MSFKLPSYVKHKHYPDGHVESEVVAPSDWVFMKQNPKKAVSVATKQGQTASAVNVNW